MSALLDPKTIIAIKNLQLAAKTTVDSFMMGINKSNVKGQGLEFSQYRIYEPGDDLRWLDWKMFARSDRYYIRESEVDTSVYVRFVIDASNSMKHEDNGFTKIEYAKYVAATLGYLAFMQGDAVGVYVCTENNVSMLPAKKDNQHQKRFYHQLSSIEVNGSFKENISFKQLVNSGKQKELTIFISDMYQYQNEISDVLHTLKAYKNELIVLHLIGENERTMNYAGYDFVEDLETGEKLNIGNQKTEEYAERFQSFLNDVKQQLLNQQITYCVMNMQQTIEQSIALFLKTRNKIIR